MANPAALLLLRGLPLLRGRVPRALLIRSYTDGLSAAGPPHPREPAVKASESESGSERVPAAYSGAKGPPLPPLSSMTWKDEPEDSRWKEKEAEILEDIEPVIFLAKDILHSNRYVDGECLNDEDEKVVIEKLLAYHPHSEDKIGCGLDSIMVDRHPQFKKSRCLFVVRTDGGWIDFSYQKCLRAYIRDKYPSHAERFIREHFRRS